MSVSFSMPAIDADPWATWFAASARLGMVPRLSAVPPYPVVLNDEVRGFVERFTGSRREVVGAWFERAGRYLGMIHETLREHGLPDDLAFTAMIESGFNPMAVSRAGATGMWQFMAATARRYGLRVDKWVDERFDPEKSTTAAAAYLRDLYRLFGSWKLAQAAYNAGEMTIVRAVRATGSTDFWRLSGTRLLKRETKDFVPAIQAATHIGRDPERYGFAFGEAGDDSAETVTVPAGTDLRKLAARSGIALTRLRDLNPVLVRGVTPPGGSWDLRVPSGSGRAVLAALAPARSLRAVHQGDGKLRASAAAAVHVVRPRETVSGIAKRYGVSVTDVLRWNKLEPDDTIRPGDRLKVTEFRPTVVRDGQGGFR